MSVRAEWQTPCFLWCYMIFHETSSSHKHLSASAKTTTGHTKPLNTELKDLSVVVNFEADTDKTSDKPTRHRGGSNNHKTSPLVTDADCWQIHGHRRARLCKQIGAIVSEATPRNQLHRPTRIKGERAEGIHYWTKDGGIRSVNRVRFGFKRCWGRFVGIILYILYRSPL